MTRVSELAGIVENSELNNIRDVRLVERLRSIVKGSEGVSRFGKRFHPIRYSFVHVNFIVGSRQEMHEIFWAGLARNLYEEAGGGVTAAHNELYRNFLRSIGIPSDEGLHEVEFSKTFNTRWREFARLAPVDEAVLAVAIYEILDRPDYGSLYDALAGINEKWDLEFFKIHSEVEHFDMFSEFVAWYFEHKKNAQVHFNEVSEFVLDVQKNMWIGLLAGLESAEAQKVKSRCLTTSIRSEAKESSPIGELKSDVSLNS